MSALLVGSLFFFLFLSTSSVTHPSYPPLGNSCDDTSTINKTSKLSSNIDRLLPDLVMKTKSQGFIATSVGSGSTRVYGLAQCRGDVSRSDCADCIDDAAKQIRQACPTQADSKIWYDFCFLRYGTENFIGKVDTSDGILYANTENATDPEVFKKKLGGLVDKIEREAVKPRTGGLGKGETKLSPLVTLYGLVQCTRDLPPLDCAQCIAIAVENVFPGFCDHRKGCRVLYSSCYVRYELYPFFYPLNGKNNGVIERANVIRRGV